MDRSPYAAMAPVTLVWRPVPKELQSEQPIGSIPPEEHQVWVWVHDAAFDETILCLQTACERQCIKSSTGVCEVGGLVTLRARQLLDEKWKGQSAIFLLAQNATSSIYRPALASIVLGKQTDVL